MKLITQNRDLVLAEAMDAERARPATKAARRKRPWFRRLATLLLCYVHGGFIIAMLAAWAFCLYGSLHNIGLRHYTVASLAFMLAWLAFAFAVEVWLNLRDVLHRLRSMT